MMPAAQTPFGDAPQTQQSTGEWNASLPLNDSGVLIESHSFSKRSGALSWSDLLQSPRAKAA